jgi:polyhydroxyalkanoate synthesis regulator phasin
VNKALQRYLDAASGITNLTTNKAEQVVKGLVRSGEAAGDQAETLVKDLLDRQQRNRDAVVALVKSETTRAVRAMGLATGTEVATAKKATAKKATAKKATAKKATAKKATAKKATAKKATAKKADREEVDGEEGDGQEVDGEEGHGQEVDGQEGHRPTSHPPPPPTASPPPRGPRRDRRRPRGPRGGPRLRGSGTGPDRRAPRRARGRPRRAPRRRPGRPSSSAPTRARGASSPSSTRSELAPPRRRLDAELVRRGARLVRTEAQEAIAAGLVTVDGAPALKAPQVHAGQALVVAAPRGPTSRAAGEKLAHALDRSGSTPPGRCLDAGVSRAGSPTACSSAAPPTCSPTTSGTARSTNGSGRPAGRRQRADQRPRPDAADVPPRRRTCSSPTCRSSRSPRCCRPCVRSSPTTPRRWCSSSRSSRPAGRGRQGWGRPRPGGLGRSCLEVAAPRQR